MPLGAAPLGASPLGALDGDGLLSGRVGEAIITLAAVTTSASVTVAIKGTSLVTLGSVTSTATATLLVKGTLSGTLGAATLSAQGYLEKFANLMVTLDPLTGNGSARMANAWSAGNDTSTTWTPVTATGTWTVVEPVEGAWEVA